MAIDFGFFEKCAFISVDIQEGQRGGEAKDETLPPDWKKWGFTADDINKASAFAWDVATPNAIKVVENCRAAGLPMIFIHWGHQFKDGMDLDPLVRQMMIRNHGEDHTKWGGHISSPGSRPASFFNIQENEYVLAKTAQDAFISSNLHFVLANLGVHSLIFIGGHTEACLGKTATSAKRLGYQTLCVHDATNNARESTRQKGIDDAAYDYVVDTVTLTEALDAWKAARA